MRYLTFFRYHSCYDAKELEVGIDECTSLDEPAFLYIFPDMGDFPSILVRMADWGEGAYGIRRQLHDECRAGCTRDYNIVHLPVPAADMEQ